MKKLVTVLIVLGTITGIGRAQELGLRFGDIVSNSIAIDGVFGMGGHRIHADVSFGDGMGIEALMDFIMKPLNGEAFYYYIGAGAFTWLGDPFQLGISGELGLEYRFNTVPLALGLDWRPALRIIDKTDFHADRFGFNIRYVF
jgi:hypothetical protein